jgi:hypothetical protein
MLFSLRSIDVSNKNKDTGTYGCIPRLGGIAPFLQHGLNFLPEVMRETTHIVLCIYRSYKKFKLYQVLLYNFIELFKITEIA